MYLDGTVLHCYRHHTRLVCPVKVYDLSNSALCDPQHPDTSTARRYAHGRMAIAKTGSEVVRLCASSALATTGSTPNVDSSGHLPMTDFSAQFNQRER